MIRNYSDFCTELLSAGFSIFSGTNDEGVLSLLTPNFCDHSEVRWHTENPDTDPWEWRIRVLDERSDIAYSKVFFRKAGYITVEEFTYMGYDINKLIEIANQHSEIFKNNETGNIIAQNIAKANIDDVNIRLLTLQDLHEGYHPCIINGCKIDQNSKLHAAVAEKFGGWGYVASCGSRTCGFMGIIPKDISYRDAGYLPPCQLPNEVVLLLTCYAGGGVFGEEFNLIGIAKKMIFQAINDAKGKGYLRVEAYAHPEVEPVLIKCGFTSVEWKKEKDVPQVYYKLDL